jgi:glycogen operon protein
VQLLRARQQRNFLLTLFLSQGVPMLVAGDEFGHTQHGNNNAYCQDNAISWLPWTGTDRRLLSFVKETFGLRRKHSIFRRSQFFQGESIRGSNLTDIGWFRPDGEEMTDENWRMHYARAIAVFLNGQGLRTPGSRGERLVDDSFLVLFNAHVNYVDFTVPEVLDGHAWRDEINTAWPEGNRARETFRSGAVVRVEAHSIRVLRRKRLAPRRSTMNEVPPIRDPGVTLPGADPASAPLGPHPTPAPPQSAVAHDSLLHPPVQNPNKPEK